jgi:hypothetical protein
VSLLALALLVPQGPHKLVTDNFLYVFKPGPTGPGMRAATGGRAAGGSSPWGAPPWRPLAWRTRAKGCRPETTRLRHQRTTPWGSPEIRDLWLSAAAVTLWRCGGLIARALTRKRQRLAVSEPCRAGRALLERFYEALVRGVCEFSECLGIVRAFTGSLAVVGILPARRSRAVPAASPALGVAFLRANLKKVDDEETAADACQHNRLGNA